MELSELRPGAVVKGPVLPEPIEVLVVQPFAGLVKVIGTGQRTGQTCQRVLHPDQVALLVSTPARHPFDGEPPLFRLGIEALRLGLAYEYDPYFSLSIARVDPLPHQLEAVYDYFLKLPRIRFLLADDPGAGKTIMAGLLLKELKARGLVRRTLVVAPANLTFQWQRELKDKFRENFEVLRSDVLRANYGQNPWQDRDQIITSVSWVSRIDDARESLLRSNWDLVIVDEAHKMSAASEDHKTLAYRLGEALGDRTDHYLLMTATPHKGDPENFCLFLQLLDRDVYGDVTSLEEAMRRNSAPFYLRRTKEALVTFPDPEHGHVRKLFTKREVQTVAFDLDGDEFDFYDALTRYVEDQSIRAAADDSARGRALGFTMAMLQRRMASSIYAVHRSLDRMRDRRQKILDDPVAWRRDQIEQRVPDDFEDLPEDEQQDILDRLECVVVDPDPAALREEIAQMTALIAQARRLEEREIESKLCRLREILTQRGMFDDPNMKLLLFTEHKDTLDFLAGDGKDGRPLGRFRQWGLTVTQIHGGMKIGDRDTPGTRIHAERDFKENAQVLVATEAAGEGINLQFCWFMVNFDIPWNPVRLEQRMGRIHRYGQPKDCLILNFVAVNTREGRVLQRLLDRLREIRSELGTDQVFDVVGEVFPANLLERLFRDLYSRKVTEPDINARIVRDVSPERFRRITESLLEGLARRELNLSAIVGRSVEARERRLVPEVVQDFFVAAAPRVGIQARPAGRGGRLFRVGRVPRGLWPIGERQEHRFGRLGRDYPSCVFDKAVLADEPTAEWVTPGHPLFEAVREAVGDQALDTLSRGALFHDLNRTEPACLDVLAASVKDGRGRTLHRRLFAVETSADGAMTLRQPTIFLELVPAPEGSVAPDGFPLPPRDAVEQHLHGVALAAFVDEIAADRMREVEVIRRHVEISLNTLIDRQNVALADLVNRRIEGQNVPGLEGIIAQSEGHLDELNGRLETRRRELDMERHCMLADLTHLGRALVLPHPERTAPEVAPMVRDEEVERIAVEVAMRHERERGWDVVSVESENRGFDLISRRPHPDDPATAVEVRFIEVKGRAGVGDVALSANEYRTAQRLRRDYWLYSVFNCRGTPELHVTQDPARLDWEPVVKVEQYRVPARVLLKE